LPKTDLRVEFHQTDCAVASVQNVLLKLVAPAPRGTAASIAPEPREGVIRILRDPDLKLLASAIVYPGEGFTVAMIRSLLAGTAPCPLDCCHPLLWLRRGGRGVDGAVPERQEGHQAASWGPHAVKELRGLLGPAGGGF
jgi:hypothetical protein